jgi:hypothetical protein
MKVNSINQNYQNPRFTGITKITCDGLYKKHPEISKEILETLKKNQVAMDFCKKHDVHVALFANKDDFTSVSNSFFMFYKKLEKKGGFLNKIIESFKSRKKIELFCFANEYDTEKSFLKSASDMKAKISTTAGYLDSQIKYTLKEEAKELQSTPIKKAITKEQAEKINAKKDLDNTIKNLMEE